MPLRPALANSASRGSLGRSIVEMFRMKDARPVFTKLIAVLIAAALVFGGAAATAYASQASLPNDALYGVKTFGESLVLSLAPQANDKLGLALEFAQRRVDEMEALKQSGMSVPEHVAAQYQEQVEYTLQLAAGMSDDHITSALEQIHTSLQNQLNRIEQLQQLNPDDPALTQVRNHLQEQIHLTESGMTDPQQFRLQIHARQQLGQLTREPVVTQEPSATITPGPGDESNNANGNINGNANEVDNFNGNNNEDGNSNANTNTDGSENGNGNENSNSKDDGNGGNGNDGGGSRDDNQNGHGGDNSNDNGGHGGDNSEGGGGSGNGNGNG
jgi:uncharacterized membrane protein YgcG